MRKTNSIVRRAVTATVVFGALSLAPVVQAGAATVTTPADHSASVGAKAHLQLVCSHAQKGHAKRVASGKGFSKRAAHLLAEETKAKAAGHQHRAAYLAKMVAHYQAVAARLGRTQAKMNARHSARAARKCAVANR